ncbi:MAG TPA: MoxR family ATPase [Thermoanaerobaculia bacterium]|nr:MoxR family ATPase [Thermoanaerobaculia bacterium]
MSIPKLKLSRDEAEGAIESLLQGLRTGILGQEVFLRSLVAALLADGHVLIEGVPGLGKTRAVNLLARLCQVHFKRLQFTPDLLPSDVLGTRVFNQHSATFETVRGPIFAHFVLADEINRAPAKVQSALLETMQERQVTIGQETLPLAPPFLVFATQNPIEQEGTYPLPEAQLDRFLMKLQVGYPELDDEGSIVRLVLDEAEPPSPEPLLDHADVLALQSFCRRVYVEARVIRYATELVAASRDPASVDLEIGPYVEYGASPRGSISLVRAAQAMALVSGRDSVLPDDVKAVAHPVLRHRIVTTYFANAEKVSADRLIDDLLEAVPAP